MEKLIALMAIVIFTACEGWAGRSCDYSSFENVVADICDEAETDEECEALRAFAREVTTHTGLVEDEKTIGTGVVIEGGRVLTALHVVEGMKTISFHRRELDKTGEPVGCHGPIEMKIVSVGTNSGDLDIGTLLASDGGSLDIAVLEPALASDAKRLPDPIVIAPGLPGVHATVWTFGLKSRWAAGRVTEVLPNGWLKTTAVGQHGDSGAPVVDVLGRLVGIHAGSNRGRGLAYEVSIPTLVGTLI